MIDPSRPFSLAEIRDALRGHPPLGHVPEHPTAKPAAVLVALFEEDGDTRVVLTKRPQTMPSHQGEIAFPGGKYDPRVDASLLDTALREAHEEVSLIPNDVEVIARLEGLSTVASKFVITPFIGILATRPVLVPHHREVVSVFDVGFAELLSEETHRSEIWTTPNMELNISFYELVGETVWGATARVLTTLFTILSEARSF